MGAEDVTAAEANQIERVSRRLERPPEQRYRYTLGEGRVLSDGAKTTRIAGFERSKDGLLEVLLEGEHGIERIPYSMLCARTPGLVDQSKEVESKSPDDPQWHALPDEVQAELISMARHLRQVVTGSPDGNLQRAIMLGRCDARYDPRSVPRLERVRNKSAELAAMGMRGVSYPSLRRKLNRFESGGVMALADPRHLRQRDPLDALSPEVAAILSEVIESAVTQSRRSARSLMMLARATLRTKGQLASVTDRQLQLAVRELSRGRALHRPYRSRRTHSNRPVGVQARLPVSCPGEIVQIDATPSNTHVWFPKVGWAAATILSAIDAYSRQILALRVIPGAVTTRDTSLLLWDICQNDVLPAGLPRTLRRWHGVPRLVAVDVDQTRLPNERSNRLGRKEALLPSTVVIDHGREFDSEHFQSACTRNGIEVLFARPNVATDKGIVESWHNILDEAQRLLPGYKGPNPQDHPPTAEQDAVLTCVDLRDMLWTWILTVYHDRPHEGLRDPSNPRIKVSPNMAFDRFAELGGHIEVPLDPYRLISFLSCDPHATIQQDGIRINHHRYNDERIVDLRARMSNGVGGKTRKLPIYYDRCDMTRVYLLHPFDHEWLCVPLSTPAGLAIAPFSEAITRAAIRDMLEDKTPPAPDELVRRELEILIKYTNGDFVERGRLDRNSARLSALEAARQTGLAGEIEAWSQEMRELAFPPTPSRSDEGLEGFDGAEQDDAEIFGYDGDDLDGLAL